MGESGQSALRIGFYYHVPATDSNGHIAIPAYLGRFVEELAKHCAGVVCFLHEPRESERPMLDYTIASDRVRLVSLGPKGSVMSRTLFSRFITRPIRFRRDEFDVLLVRGPSPLFRAAVRAAGQKPSTLLLVGDYVAGLHDISQPFWRRILIYLWAHWNRAMQDLTAKRCLTFVNSYEIMRRYQGVAASVEYVSTSTLRQADLCNIVDTEMRAPIRVLYTGRISESKGVFDMVEAISILRSHGRDVHLDLVGWSNPGEEGIEDRIAKYANDLRIADRIHMHGFVPHGDRLFRHYSNADIFLIASRYDFEGFPRSILEAMAYGVPVIATAVGGIPDILRNNKTARLVPPRDVEALARSLEEVADDDQLRSELVTGGRELAEEHTLDRVIPRMIDRIEEWLKFGGKLPGHPIGTPASA